MGPDPETTARWLADADPCPVCRTLEHLDVTVDFEPHDDHGKDFQVTCRRCESVGPIGMDGPAAVRKWNLLMVDAD